MKCTNYCFKPLGLLFLLCLIPLWAFSQNITVKGVVKDATGESVIGASVVQKGTSNGIITDIDGNFTLNVPSNSTIVISFVGYKTQEIPVAGKTQINVTMKEDTEMLDEVVVVGYGQMKRSDLTGSVVSVNDQAIKKSVPTSIDQVLQRTRCRCADSGKLRYTGCVHLYPHPWYQLTERHQPAYLRDRRRSGGLCY